jgi:hypothetical protein
MRIAVAGWSAPPFGVALVELNGTTVYSSWKAIWTGRSRPGDADVGLLRPYRQARGGGRRQNLTQKRAWRYISSSRAKPSGRTLRAR